MRKVIEIANPDSCDGCGAIDYLGQSLTLKMPDSQDRHHFMVCSDCALKHLKSLMDFSVSYIKQLEDDSE